jgi:hypothetical protein
MDISKVHSYCRPGDRGRRLELRPRRLLQNSARRWAASLGLILLLIVGLSGCQTTAVVEHPDAAGRWRYKLDTTRPNTEKGGERGRLYYRGRQLPGYFSTIIIGATRYDFAFRTDPSGFGGYAKKPGYTPSKVVSMRVDPEDLERGWYFAPMDQRRQNTPDSWIWVKRENLEAFVDPDKLYRFVKRYDLIQAPEEQESPFQFGLFFKTKI